MSSGTKIRELRQAEGMTLFDLSMKTGLNPSTLSSVECGRLAASRRLKEKLSEFYQMPTDVIFDNRDFAV